jgi:hypothetical protein
MLDQLGDERLVSGSLRADTNGVHVSVHSLLRHL